MNPSGRTAADLAESLLAGDKRALARAISLVENDDPEGWALVREVYPKTGRAAIIGFTGPPGVGKSTLIGALVKHARANERDVAVLSIDPSSPFTQGALLGDRIRLSEHFLDPGVFIRSMASRGSLGGLSEATLQAALLMDASGKDDVFLETVGVGQAEVDIIDHADTVVLVLMPGSGDSIQALKAGVMEIPDVIVVNKSDHPLTDTMIREVRGVLSLGPQEGWRVPIIRAEASRAEGVEELAEKIAEHRAHIEKEGTLSERRRRNLMNEVLALAAARLRRRLEESVREDAEVQQLLDEVVARRLDPASAATKLLERELSSILRSSAVRLFRMAAKSAKTVRRVAADGDVQKAAAAAAGAAAVAAGAVAGTKLVRGRSASRAYRVKPGETLPEGLRRVAVGRIDHALDELRGKTDHSADEAVHEARKDMKKLRALLRLVRGELGDELYRYENETFRDAARELSDVRDAQVLIETLDDLRSRARKALPGTAVSVLRAKLVRRRKALEADSGGRKEGLKRAVKVLREARGRVEEWPLESEGFDAVEPGLRRAYRRGRKRFGAAADDPSVENLHEWRKRAKDLWYHQQLLEFVNPERMEPAADGAHHLSTLLGDDHDLALLDEAVDELAVPEARPALHRAIERRRAELQADAFKLGRRIYSDKPRAFTARLERWFESARA